MNEQFEESAFRNGGIQSWREVHSMAQKIAELEQRLDKLEKPAKPEVKAKSK